MAKSTKPQYIAYIIFNKSNSKYYLCITKKTSISKGRRRGIARPDLIRKKKIVKPKREIIEKWWNKFGKSDYYVFFSKPREYNKKVFEKETQEERIRMVREGLYSDEDLIRYYEA